MKNRKESDPIQFQRNPRKKHNNVEDNKFEDPVPLDEVNREEKEQRNKRASKSSSRTDD
ncbi:hypothetical protein [Geomicrobium sp. JCM 19039]|uniref:hypothetical protein n=1 Tax=Geomicrobium sp. JCM 19039 TaxID=1460636 RepID=UPI00045F13D8|nr:hypothetical protein [Geomicrobium sp. JCM 19039]GAK14603.1 hypothetical protein JCM19039_4538 [Geomicrobium sp. JCM 19039]